MTKPSIDLLSVRWTAPATCSRQRPEPAVIVEGTRPARERVPNKLSSPCPDHGFGTSYSFTLRESEALGYALEGIPYAHVAQIMGIGLRTVKLLLGNAYRKLGVRNRAEALSLSLRSRQAMKEMPGDWSTWFSGSHQARRLEAGSILFRHGEPGDGLYLLENGRIVLEGIGKVMSDGGILGELGVFAPAHLRTSTAICESPVELRFLSAHDALVLYYSRPAFALHILKLIASRLIADSRPTNP